MEVGGRGFKRSFITPQVPKLARVRARAEPRDPGPALTVTPLQLLPHMPESRPPRACPEVGKTRHSMQAPGFLGALASQQTPRPGGNR